MRADELVKIAGPSISYPTERLPNTPPYVPANADSSNDKHKFYSVIFVSVFRMRKTDAAGITPDQARILALLDSGAPHTEVVEQLDMPPQ